MELLEADFSAKERQLLMESTLAALLRQDSPESDKSALQILISACESVNVEKSKTSADAVFKKINKSVQEYASSRLRKALADSICETSDSTAKSIVFLPLLCESNPLNLEAQLVIYQSQVTDNATRLKLEKNLLSLSKEMLQTFFDATNHKSTTPPSGNNSVSSIQTQLWSTAFARFLDLQHQALTELKDRPSAVALAATIPNVIMRDNLQQTLSRHWSEGPPALKGTTAADSAWAEPGFITVLKAVSRENARKGNSQSLRPTKTTQPKNTPETKWDKLTEELVMDYCRRSHMAALARSAVAYLDNSTLLNENSKNDASIPLLPGCEVSAEYRIVLPSEKDSQLPNSSGNDFKLHYQRIEKRMKLNKPLAFYRRQVKSCIEHPVEDGLWLDGLFELKSEDSIRSVDVLITLPAKTKIKSTAEEQELTIEILCIDVGKPRE